MIKITPNTPADTIVDLKSASSGKNSIIKLYSNREEKKGSSAATSDCSSSESEEGSWTDCSDSEDKDIEETSFSEINKFQFGSQDDSYYNENKTLESENDNNSRRSKSYFERDLTEELLNFCKNYEGADSWALDSLLKELKAPSYTFEEEKNDHMLLNRFIFRSRYGACYFDLSKKYEIQTSSKRLAILQKIQDTIKNIGN